MKEKLELLLYKNGRQVAVQDITTWTVEEVEKLLEIEERQRRTCEYQKTYRWEKGEEANNEKTL